MTLSELAAYAEKKYNISEQHKWDDFPGFTVLTHPQTDKWIALLMRQWDTETGEMIETCDMKCGAEAIDEYKKTYLSGAVRMIGPKWANIRFDGSTEPAVVYELFDRAVNISKQYGYTVVLNNSNSAAPSTVPEPVRIPRYSDTVIPVARGVSSIEKTPERIRKLRLMFPKYNTNFETAAASFYRNAVYMRDFEDNYPWDNSFKSYFPTYQDMTLRQLRGYFSWRTQVRKGNYSPISNSAAYVYIYEILNGIGAETVHERLRKLKEFDDNYIKAGYGDAQMSKNLHEWMKDLAIVFNLPKDEISGYKTEEKNEFEYCIAVLRDPGSYSDKEVFNALCSFEPDHYNKTIEYIKYRERTEFVFSESWRIASSRYCTDGKDLFTLCFGEKEKNRWYPFLKAVYCKRGRQRDVTVSTAVCTYCCENGQWFYETFLKHNINKKLIRGFLHATDLKLRRYLKCEPRLHEKLGEEWAYPYIDEAMELDRRRETRAARERFAVDLSGLDKIRVDASETRDSLLVEEEPETVVAAAEPVPVIVTEPAAAEAPVNDSSPAVELAPDLLTVLTSLLREEDPKEFIKEKHLLPSLLADTINESLFDEIGDNAIICENDTLSIAEEYIDDIKHLIGGAK